MNSPNDAGICRDILTTALKSTDPLLAAEAARLIGEWNGKALIPELIENALTSRFYSKVSAIHALTRLAATEAIPSLEKLVEKPNVPDDFYWTGFKGVRAAAAVALLGFGNKAGVPYLLKLAEAEDEVFVRWYAPALLRLEPLEELRGYLTVEKLCDRKRRDAFELIHYTEPGEVCMLCEALGLIGSAEAVEHLEFYMNFHSRFVRGQAYRSLHLCRSDEATTQKISECAERHGTDFDRLVAAEVQNDSETLADVARNAKAGFDRASAIDALGNIHSPRLSEACLRGLEDGDAYVRQTAVERLGRDAEQKQRIVALLNTEKEPGVRCAIAATMLN